MTAFFKNHAVPVLLFTFLCSSTIYIYAHSDLTVVALLSLFSAVYGTALFALCDKLQRTGKTVISMIVIPALLIVSSLISFRLIETDYMTTAQWLLEPSNINHIYVGNITALLLDFGYILGCALFYFTSVRYRAVFVFLICMCPFSLFAKTFTSIPVIYIILIATFFFILMIIKASGEAVFYGKRSYVAFGLFVAAVVAAAAFLPKLSSAPYREDFDELITGMQIGAPGQADFSNFSDSSAYSTSKDDKTVFTIFGENPMLIKRQCFNIYDPATEQWSYYGEAGIGYKNWENYLNWQDPSRLSVMYNGDSQKHTAWLHFEQGALKALYTPENMTAVSLQNSAEKNIYRTPMDEFFVSIDSRREENYKIEWCDFTYDGEFSRYYSEETARAGSGARAAGYYKALTEMKELYSYIMEEQTRRSCYNSADGYERIKILAAELTAGCADDYEKAKAIESFFLSDDFIYDDSFAPVDSSVENFVFNTKRGVCSDYASAMTLICREAGLYSRYVEGFLVQKVNDAGNFFVTAADSHAYVQVWLDGYGWTDFDPTSSNSDSGYVDMTFFVFGGIALFIGLVITVALLFIPVIREKSFMRRAAKRRGSAQVMLLFPRLNSFLHQRLGKKSEVYTIKELKEQAALRYGIDVSPIADEYERAAYGGREAENRDYLAIYREITRAVGEAEKRERKARKKAKK